MDKMMPISEQISLFCRLTMNAKRKLPIRSSEMGMLIYLVKTDGNKTPNAAAKFFNITKAMATNTVTALLNNGYILRQQSEADKRSFILIPTNKAISLVNETYEDYFKMITMLESKMGETKFNEFIQLLETANNILLEDKKNG